VSQTKEAPYNITLTVTDNGRNELPKLLIGEGNSNKNNHRRRYNAKLEYIAKITNWLEAEPKMYHIFAWRRWKKNRPIYRE
jgi:hypothetical protein